MKPAPLPPVEVRSAALPGTFYRSHSITVAGQVIHSQLSPYSEAEIAERIRSYVSPEPVRAMPAFDAKAHGYSSKGGSGKKRSARVDPGDA